MGRHVEEFLRMHHAGQIQPGRATAIMAGRAVALDKAEAERGGQDVTVASSSSGRRRPLDDQLYDAIWPTPDAIVAAREAERREVHALTDAELYERLFGGSW